MFFSKRVFFVLFFCLFGLTADLSASQKKKKDKRPTAAIYDLETGTLSKKNVVTLGLKKNLKDVLDFKTGKGKTFVNFFVDTKNFYSQVKEDIKKLNTKNYVKKTENLVFVFPKEFKKTGVYEFYEFEDGDQVEKILGKEFAFFAFFEFLKEGEKKILKGWTKLGNNQKTFSQLKEFIEKSQAYSKPGSMDLEKKGSKEEMKKEEAAILENIIDDKQREVESVDLEDSSKVSAKKAEDPNILALEKELDEKEKERSALFAVYRHLKLVEQEEISLKYLKSIEKDIPNKKHYEKTLSRAENSLKKLEEQLLEKIEDLPRKYRYEDDVIKIHNELVDEINELNMKLGKKLPSFKKK